MVKHVGAFLRDQAKGFREIFLHQQIALHQRHAAGAEHRFRFRLQRCYAAVNSDIGGEKFVDAKAVVGYLDRRLQGFGKADRAVVLERGVEHRQRARHAHRNAAGRGEAEQVRRGNAGEEKHAR